MEHAFEKILYRIAAWSNKGSGWIIESIESQYINISTHRPFVRKFLHRSANRSKTSKKRINKEKKYLSKRFLWCRVRHINLLKEHPERILKNDKKIACNLLNYDEIEFLLEENDFKKIEVKKNICINVFGCENELVFPIYNSDQKFENSIDLLLLINDDESHYVYIKGFNTFMFHKTKNKNKKWFCRSCLQYFSSENVSIKHKEDCLSINGKQLVNLAKEIIQFEN